MSTWLLPTGGALSGGTAGSAGLAGSKLEVDAARTRVSSAGLAWRLEVVAKVRFIARPSFIHFGFGRIGGGTEAVDGDVGLLGEGVAVIDGGAAGHLHHGRAQPREREPLREAEPG